MKPRRVIVQTELETAKSIKEIKYAFKLPTFIGGECINPIQISVNIIRQPEPKKTLKRR